MVKVRRIVANLAAEEVGAVAAFYRDTFDLEVLMDQGWIMTLGGAPDGAAAQMSVIAHGGSGAPAPDLTIEVDDLDAVYVRAVARGTKIAYPLTKGTLGGAAVFLCDPGGRLVNVAAHI